MFNGQNGCQRAGTLFIEEVQPLNEAVHVFSETSSRSIQLYAGERVRSESVRDRGTSKFLKQLHATCRINKIQQDAHK